MEAFSKLNARLNVYIGFCDMNQEDKSIRFVVNNIASQLSQGEDHTLTRINYDAQIKAIEKAKQYIEKYGTEHFFEFCQDQIEQVSKSIDKLLQLS